MPRYVQLIEYTAEGIDRFEEIPDLTDQARELADSLGGELVDFYLTLGQYDAVAVVDAPDDETMVAGTVTMAKTGTIKTETLRAFEQDEIESIVDAVEA
ncbi:MAG: GYD domain-containing protein [Salinirussus sp.]